MTRLDKKRMALNFGRAAKDYERHAVLQNLVCERLLSRLDMMKLAPRWVIDAGAGAGRASRALKKKFRSAHILQLELSFEMLQQSRRQSRFWFSGQHYVCADTERLPLAPGCTGLVFSSLALQWCEEPGQFFREARRVLDTNGLLLFATLGPRTLHELRASWAGVDPYTHVHEFTDMHMLGDALVQAGLEGVVMESELITLTYPGCREVMRDLKHLGAGNAASARRKGLTGPRTFARVTAAYEAHRKNGVLPATYEIVYGHAWAPRHGDRKTAAPLVSIPVRAVSRRGRLEGST